MDKQGICSFPHPSAHLLLAALDAGVGGWNRLLTCLSSHTKRVRYGVGIPVCPVKIKCLSLVRLEGLGDALLDFTQMGDLMRWLDENE